MRTLLSLIILGAIAWSGYWFVGSSGLQTGVAQWFDDRRGEGWLAEYNTHEVQGFPNRFDSHFNNIYLADPGTGWAWTAPEFQINALSYNPGHLIAVWPDQQKLATPIDKYDITSEDMRASIVAENVANLTLNRATITATELDVTDSKGHTAALSSLVLAAERLPESEEAVYRLGLQIDDFKPSLPWKKLIDPSGALPDSLDAINADLTVAFDELWSMEAINTARPQPRNIHIRLVEARWGKLLLQLAGEVSVDSIGYPTGEVTVKARNWKEILELAIASGAVPEGIGGSLKDGLSLLSTLSGNPETLDIPLTFEYGKVKFGPVPLGPAPVLKLR
ncbi:hypothetical protein ROA7450_02783 [Roseovarius albus]|uniref:DUF2125 domain-containing protein n=1 Tax=Roseovarius albus TaxID=1247867 RepID=A0A1X6ZKR4_9RHOB|nr:DUF2125 domain-containing protein [Roseovarius albus]SLN54146.1 hypothetical protein ROA7450_02783 [Roseovarius albus]